LKIDDNDVVMGPKDDTDVVMADPIAAIPMDVDVVAVSEHPNPSQDSRSQFQIPEVDAEMEDVIAVEVGEGIDVEMGDE
jgi:hypothetical protein